LASPTVSSLPATTERSCSYLQGVTAGVLASVGNDAVAWLKRRSRNFSHATPPQTPIDDRQVLQVVGEIAADAFAARAIVLIAAEKIQDAFDSIEDGAPTIEAKVAVDRFSYATAAKLFDVGGASATQSLHNLDRHVGLLFVGAVLFLNGLLFLGKADAKVVAVFNLFVGVLQTAIPFYLIATAKGPEEILGAAGIFLFGFTYLYVGIVNLAGLSSDGIGWYSLWVAVMATGFGLTNILRFHDTPTGLLWLQWAVLWGLFWVVLALGGCQPGRCSRRWWSLRSSSLRCATCLFSCGELIAHLSRRRRPRRRLKGRPHAAEGGSSLRWEAGGGCQYRTTAQGPSCLRRPSYRAGRSAAAVRRDWPESPVP
jgi:hypothetical protein